jgi:RNA polymerase sigma-70 factor, ECF subfamily
VGHGARHRHPVPAALRGTDLSSPGRSQPAPEQAARLPSAQSAARYCAPVPGAEDDARDRALLAAHLAGDGDAFGLLVAHHRDRLWAVAVRTLGDREEAADALQDALLSAYRSAASYRGEARVTTWLHRVVVNACLDRLRRRRARPSVPLPTGRDEPASARDELAERETALDVAQALAALPDDQRAALVLVDLQGMPVEQAARVLGVPAGTVKSRCSRGRARLAVALGHLRNPAGSRTVTPGTGPPAQTTQSTRTTRTTPAAPAATDAAQTSDSQHGPGAADPTSATPGGAT